MPRITFTDTRVVRDHLAGTPDETKFEAGKTYDLPVDSCERWILRGVAHYARELAEPAAVVLRREERDGETRVVLVGEWPLAVRITRELMEAGLDGMTVEPGFVSFSVANGTATYAERAEGEAGGDWVGDLAAHAYVQVPEWPKPTQNAPAGAFRIVPARFGKKNVLGADGKPVNEKPLTQVEAETLAAELSAKKPHAA